MPIQAVAFDLGDTLIYYKGAPLNWESLYGDALTLMARHCPHEPSEAQIDAAKSILRQYNTRLNPRSREVSSDEIIGSILDRWGVSRRHLEDATLHFFRFFQQELAVYDDTLDVLSALRSSGIPIGVLTDVPYGMKPEYLLQDLRLAGNLQNYIDVFLTSVDIGYRKPEPHGYHRLASGLGVHSSEVLYVGNEEKDILGATAAGMPSLLVWRDGSPPEWGQSAYISCLRQVLAYTNKLRKVGRPPAHDNHKNNAVPGPSQETPKK